MDYFPYLCDIIICMNTVTGNIVDIFKGGGYDYLPHGANCQVTMRSGVAWALVQAWPQVMSADVHFSQIATPLQRLGKFTLAQTDYGIIVNLYTQLHYGYDGKKFVSYDAVDESLERFAKYAKPNSNILLPKIGSARGGGNWNVIKEIITHRLVGHNLTLVNYEPK
jgi:O-acetyl-ADP-ribose deacetylase (regulator of RNase III)